MLWHQKHANTYQMFPNLENKCLDTMYAQVREDPHNRVFGDKITIVFVFFFGCMRESWNIIEKARSKSSHGDTHPVV